MITYKRLMDYMDEGYSIDRIFRNDRMHSNIDIHAPYKYEGIYEYIGYANIWNDVGCVEYCFRMYRPIGSGTILYDVNV